MQKSAIISEVNITMNTEGFHLTLSDNERMKCFLANIDNAEGILKDIKNDLRFNVAYLEKEKQERVLVPLRIVIELSSGIQDSSLKEELLRIHHSLFSDMYDWAGKIRHENIYKNGMMFCHHLYIDKYLNELCEGIDLKNLQYRSKDDISPIFAAILCEVNNIHPFRDGNGRASRVWLQKIANYFGYDLLFSKSSVDEIIYASIQGMISNYTPMSDIIYKGLSLIGM